MLKNMIWFISLKIICKILKDKFFLKKLHMFCNYWEKNLIKIILKQVFRYSSFGTFIFKF